jgi:hypothetical protein
MIAKRDRQQLSKRLATFLPFLIGLLFNILTLKSGVFAATPNLYAVLDIN